MARPQLGNTGSKSTIHRYLREIEEESSARLDDEALLSQPIKELIGRLASCLKEEAQTIITENQNRYDQEVKALTSKVGELENMLAKSKTEIQNKAHELSNALAELSDSQASENALKTQVIETQQTETRLKSVLDEKQVHIDSLEEKHRHNRDAMEHYRQSVKEQREQDQRRHEQQVQQLQAEIRTLNQTISVKQTDITQLNKDNGRLVAELGIAQKAAVALEVAHNKLQGQFDSLTLKENSLEEQLTKMKTQCIELESLKDNIEKLRSWKEVEQVSLAKLEAEVTVKTDIIDRLMSDKNRNASDPADK
ncbi:MAG: chromosome segregation ATPase [Marinomonas primoryensis]